MHTALKWSGTSVTAASLVAVPVGNLIMLAAHRELGDAFVQLWIFSGSLVGRLSIYFGRGQRSRQRFGHYGSKLTFCGVLLLRDSRSASSTTWYSLGSSGCFQRFAMRWRS